MPKWDSGRLHRFRNPNRNSDAQVRILLSAHKNKRV